MKPIARSRSQSSSNLNSKSKAKPKEGAYALFTFRPVEPLFEPMGRYRGVSFGGVAAIRSLVAKLGFPDAIERALSLLKIRRGYSEADHVLNIALNPLFGGRTLDDIELRRRDAATLQALGADALPDPTTAGDFCRRFSETDIDNLMDATNEIRKNVWAAQPSNFRDTARIDADGVFVPTGAETAEGVDWSGHKRDWGYHPLVISLANTQEPLFLVNRSGARPSYEGAAAYLDKAVDLCRSAGFRQIILRGDTDFSQTKFLDGWNENGVHFVFGLDAMPNLVRIVEEREDLDWHLIARESRQVDEEDERARPRRYKEEVIVERQFRHLELEEEHLAEFEYQPTACKQKYRVVVTRKTIRVTKGCELLMPETRYFFHITNIRDCPAREVVREANDRCNQENLNSHLKSGVHALRAPLKSLLSNWAYMVMVSLAWTFKAWFALMAPEKASDPSLRRRLLTMEFRTFVENVMHIPCLVITTGRRLVLRLLTETPWTGHFVSLANALRE